MIQIKGQGPEPVLGNKTSVGDQREKPKAENNITLCTELYLAFSFKYQYKNLLILILYSPDITKGNNYNMLVS